jgi:hypothetical protein
MHRTTKIADRDVFVEPGVLIAVHFSAGRCGEAEAGDWEFWAVYKGKTFIVRCRQCSDPGERFRRMEGIQGY